MLRHAVSVVSGGASGLGAAAVSNIIRNGGRAIVADLPSQRDSFEALAASLQHDDKNTKNSIAFAEADVTQTDQVESALDLAESTFGQPVNVAVCCAGMAFARRSLSPHRPKEKDEGSTSTTTPAWRLHGEDDFIKTLHVNTVGTFNLATRAARRMVQTPPASSPTSSYPVPSTWEKDQLKGCILLTSSIAANDGQTGQIAYAASKGAVSSMTLPLARDLAPLKIRVMTIAPGLFATRLLLDLPEVVQKELASMVPCPSRLGDPEEFGGLVVEVLRNGMLNGEVVRLDGALRMPP